MGSGLCVCSFIDLQSGGSIEDHIGISGRTIIEKDNKVIVTVSDSGPGFSHDELSRIFQPYFTTKSDGSGLGLALVKYIVSAHGGEVWAHSRPNQGSTFGFQIPLGQPEASLEQVSLMLPDQNQLWGR